MSIPKQTSVWDERRNSSRVFPVAPDALDNARCELKHFRETQPALYAWVAEGAPNLTEEEHVARFGAPYRKHTKGTASR